MCAAAQIKLSTKSFDAAAAGVAAEAIVNCAASLTHADLSDVIAGRPEAEALNSLRILSGALAQVPAMSASLCDKLCGHQQACRLTAELRIALNAMSCVGLLTHGMHAAQWWRGRADCASC
jgi:Ran GTPase-activating protein 1